MESSSPSKSILYGYITQGYPGGFHSLQEGQHGNIRAEGFPTPTYRVSAFETAMQKASSSDQVKASIALPVTGFDTRSAVHDGNSNGFPNFSLTSKSTSPPTKHSGTWDNKPLIGNGALNSMPMQVSTEISPLMFDFQAHLAPHEPMESELPGFPGLGDMGSLNEGFPMLFNDTWSLNPAVTQFMPLGSGDRHTKQFHTPDQDIFDVQQWVLEPPMSLATSISSYDLYSPFQPGELWDPSFLDDMEDTPPSFPGTQPVYTFPASNSQVATRSNSIPTNSDQTTSSSALAPTKALKLRNIMPKLPSLPSDEVSDTNNDDVTQKGSVKLGRRRRLTTEEKEAAARLRQIGSCARCIAGKAKCTEGDVCAPCRDIYLRYTLHQAPICPRGRLVQYNDAFFSPFIVAHLEQVAVQNLMSNVQFCNDKKRVHMTLGSSYPSLSLEVSEFRTGIEKLSYVPDLASKANDHLMTFTSIATLQYGVPNAALGHLKQACTNYIEVISNCTSISMGSSRITRETFNAIRRFQQASPPARQDELLSKAIRITTIYHLLARRFFFSEDSSLETAGIPHYQSTDLPSLRSNSSKVVNQQIKAALHSLLKELIPEALLYLDERLRYQKKELWASCLCALLLLCTCIEQIQVVADAFILSNLSSEAGDPAPIRQCGLDISCRLEEQIFEHLQVLLDGLLKGIVKKYKIYRAGVQLEGEAGPSEVGLSKEEIMLMNELWQIIEENYEEITKRAEDNYYGGHSQNVGDYKKFRSSNCARMLSKVLLRLYWLNTGPFWRKSCMRSVSRHMSP